MISAFISGKGNKTKDLRAFAQQNLRGLPFDQLRMDDLRHAREHTGRDQGDMLAHTPSGARAGSHLRIRRCRPGGVN